MNEMNAATTAAHNAMMTASLSNSTLLVNTSAELATIARTSNADNKSQPGLRLLRRWRIPRVGSVMGRLYLSQVTSRVDLGGDSAGQVGHQLLRDPVGLVGRLLWRLAAMLKP